jgi:hypothetical protein
VNNFYFDQKDLNAGLVMWFNKHASQLDIVRNNKGSYIDSIGKENKALWTSVGSLGAAGKYQVSNTSALSRHTKPDMNQPVLVSSTPLNYATTTTVGPLCQTLWGQIYPWNQDCPVDNATIGSLYQGRDPSGCVEVAMAQLMYFWKWPGIFNWAVMAKSLDYNTPSLRYYSNPGGFTGSATLMSNIGTTPGTFWTNVLHSFQSSKFAYYSANGTTSDMEYCATVFNQFGYSSATTSEGIADQIASGARNGTTYLGLLTNEIQNNRRPCLVGGNNSENNEGLFYLPSSDAHSWVCDGSSVIKYYSGYQNTYESSNDQITVQTVVSNYSTVYMLHMNWGYQGTDNAWYDADTDYTNVPSVQEDFRYFQLVTYNIHP